VLQDALPLKRFFHFSDNLLGEETDQARKLSKKCLEYPN
jgi:hypothetical protein